MIYRLLIDSENSCTLMLDDPNCEWNSFYNTFFCGNPLPSDWEKPIHLWGRKRNKLKDFIFGSNYVPFASERARDVLGECCGSSVEFFFARKIKGINYYFFNVIRVSDCLDRGKSRILYLSNGGISTIREYRFTDKVPLKGFFKIPEENGEIFTTGTVVDVIKNNRLTGIWFDDPGKCDKNSIVEGLPFS